MYLEYWGLKRHPFDNVPDPAMYFDMHQSVDDAVGELLFAVQEGDDCLAVVVGPVGVGKTMCLRIVLDSLDHDKYRIAFVTNPDMTFTQLLREIIGQLQGKICEEHRKDRLFEIFNRILFETSDQHKRVVIFIDEGNVIKPHNLDSLRLLTNMQDDHQNLFTIILAGQMELARRLEDPRRANLYQRIGVYCKLQGIDSLETMRDYVDHRLERAGRDPKREVFTPAAFRVLWNHSDGGIPRLVNKLCKLSLKAGETNGLTQIDAPIVEGIGARFMRTYHVQKKRAAVAPPPAEDLALENECASAPAVAPVPVPAPAPVAARPPTPAPVAAAPQPLPPVPVQAKIAATPAPAATATPPKPAPPPAPAKKPDETVKPVLPAARPAAPLAAEAKPAAASTPPPPPPEEKPVTLSPHSLSRDEIEKLASKLATERVKTLTQVADPFEAWEKVRDEILTEMLKARQVSRTP